MCSLQIYDQCAPTISIQGHSGKFHCRKRQNTFEFQARNKFKAYLLEGCGQFFIKWNHKCRVPRSVLILRLGQFARPITGLQRFVYKLAQVAIAYRRETMSAFVTSPAQELAGKQRVE